VYVFVLGCWVTLIVKSFELKIPDTLSDDHRRIFEPSLRKLQFQVWTFFFFSLAAWLISTFVAKLNLEAYAYTTVAVVAVYLFLISVGNLVLWPVFWHRLDNARAFIAEREKAERDRKAVLEAMRKAADADYKPVDHYKGYTEVRGDI
jgi:hypothetical protein